MNRLKEFSDGLHRSQGVEGQREVRSRQAVCHRQIRLPTDS
jgi:hypothetical protein